MGFFVDFVGWVGYGCFVLVVFDGNDMNDDIFYCDEWFFVSFGNMLIWVCLCIWLVGIVEVLDSDGNILSYDSEDIVCVQLFDVEFVVYDGLDEEDVLICGFLLYEVVLLQVVSDVDLYGWMVQSFGVCV